jgi:hypothetical protein
MHCHECEGVFRQSETPNEIAELRGRAPLQNCLGLPQFWHAAVARDALQQLPLRTGSGNIGLPSGRSKSFGSLPQCLRLLLQRQVGKAEPRDRYDGIVALGYPGRTVPRETAPLFRLKRSDGIGKLSCTGSDDCRPRSIRSAMSAGVITTISATPRRVADLPA